MVKSARQGFASESRWGFEENQAYPLCVFAPSAPFCYSAGVGQFDVCMWVEIATLQQPKPVSADGHASSRVLLLLFGDDSRCDGSLGSAQLAPVRRHHNRRRRQRNRERFGERRAAAQMEPACR